MDVTVTDVELEYGTMEGEQTYAWGVHPKDGTDNEKRVLEYNGAEEDGSTFWIQLTIGDRYEGLIHTAGFTLSISEAEDYLNQATEFDVDEVKLEYAYSILNDIKERRAERDAAADFDADD